ncbi:RNA polymerase sigma-54 factor [Rhizobium rhizosphaerae]|uniref:RNA polymerase sigma-54 factor n=1 Tax=Xaviernesmea rhizosphaerae TaxID=1672749 RepID=A0A1Q9AEV4_9HYPH|nr:RNA polymerase factor sigma-54 [Xaviernesmea rhizosphaerae]OLP53401.1 RNA polymerase sigma-54 factor [Xaviernesmea rhizosphaerae]
MALSASLFLRQSQTLAMTPQLMQSIQLLQMTHFELTHFIEQELEKNPLLELAGSDVGRGGDRMAESEAAEDFAPEAPAFDPLGDVFDSTRQDLGPGMGDQLDADFSNVFPDDGAPVRADAPELLGQWRSMPGSDGDGAEGYDLDDFVAQRRSLRDVLTEQMALSLRGERERLIGLHLIDHVDAAGYLQTTPEALAERLGCGQGEVEKVLARLQTLDPPGVFARSLAECLKIQLRALDRLDPAMEALVDHLDLLARRDFASLKRICGVDEQDILDMLAEIRALDPKPGTRYDTSPTEAIVPDIVVRPAADGGWAVELNPETLPRVLVNHVYYAKVARHAPGAGDDPAFLSECLQSANWLTRSLDQRAKTILKVATEITRQQSAFLTHGVEHLKPLNLKAIAEAIKMHESTVSRVTSNKYMMTPRGVFELKYFFTVSIGSAEGGDAHSAESIRHRIRQLIQTESADSVLSDDDIVDILKKAGVDIARRTVAKYREAMDIPSSVQRRREKRALAKISA